MGAGERLRDLDSRVLPALLRALARLDQSRLDQSWPDQSRQGRSRPAARVRLLTAVAVLSVAAVLVTAVWTAGHGHQDPPGAPRLTRVGLVEGQSLAGYLRASHGELVGLAGQPVDVETWALVSFSAYVAPQRLTPLLADATVHQVYVRAPLPGVQTQVLRLGVYRVPEDVVAGMADAARRREQERGEFVRLGGGVGRDDDGQRLHRAYDTAAQVAAAEAEAYRAACPCVFAAVVRATAATLRSIDAGAEVRAVDPAPEVTGLGEVEFRPPLPEQTTGGSGAPDEPARVPAAPMPAAAPGPSAPVPSAAVSPAALLRGVGDLPSGAPRPTFVTSASSRDPDSSSAPPGRPGPPDTAVPSALPAGPGAATPSVVTGASREASGR